MSNKQNDLFTEDGQTMPGRRNFLVAGVGFATASLLLSGIPAGAHSQQPGGPARGGATTNKGQLTKTDRRRLGSLEVSSLGLGCMSMIGVYNPPRPKQEMIALIRSAAERGVTLFDTAENYGPFTSEEIVGEALAPFKGKAVIASKEALKANMPLLDLVRAWAERKGVTPVQFSLGWLMAQKPWIVPIPGTTRLHHLEENLGAVAVKFTPDELREMRSAVSKIKVQGARSPDSALIDQ